MDILEESMTAVPVRGKVGMVLSRTLGMIRNLVGTCNSAAYPDKRKGRGQSQRMRITEEERRLNYARRIWNDQRESELHVDLRGTELVALRERLEAETEERRCAENALRASEVRFRVAAVCSNDLIYEWDFSNDRVEWFGDIDSALGYEPGEFPETLEAWEHAIHPDDHDRVINAVKEHILYRSPYEVEYRIRRKDGTYLRWMSRASALRDKEGRPYKWVGVATDVTDRTDAEEICTSTAEEEALSRNRDDSQPELVVSFQWCIENASTE
jgi:PAS domain S-box-containing protein